METSIFPDDLVHKRPNGFKLYKSDVWGKWDEETHECIDNGMIVARGLPSVDRHFTEEDREEFLSRPNSLPDKCPIWDDLLPYKSVTAVCQPDQQEEVEYWLSYVHGGGPTKIKHLPDGRIAIRSDYQAW